MAHNDGDQSESLRLSWRTVGLVGSLIGVACLGVLVTVVSIQDIDALSTVALVLAILAFTIQIMIFGAQSAAASQQSRTSLEINSETKALLSDLRARAESTNDQINVQFNKLLDKLLQVTQEADATDSSGDGVDDKFDAYLQDMRETLVELKREASVINSRPFRGGLIGTTSDSRPPALTWPPPRLLNDLVTSGAASDLSEDAALLLKLIAKQAHRTGDKRGCIHVPANTASAELISQGLVQKQDRGNRRDKLDNVHLHLSKLGQIAARVVIGRNPPESALSTFPWLYHVRDDLGPDGPWRQMD